MPVGKNGNRRPPSAQQQRAQQAQRRQRDQKYSRNAGRTAWQQAVASAPKKPFGSTKGPGGKGRIQAMVRALNARLPAHLGLPRPVGNYAVVRTTVLHSSSARMLIFAPFMTTSGATTGAWRSICGVEDVNSALPVNNAGNTAPIAIPFPGVTPSGTSTALDVCPCALTVQVMNPTAVAASGGIFAMGRCNQQWDLGDSTQTWDTHVDQFISYFSPRLLSGGKLALKGVTCSSYPLDMTEYSSFMPIVTTGAAITWNDAFGGPAAMAPIVFVQNTVPVATLDFLVTIEWRVRFDVGNPACASHIYHPPTPDSDYSKVIQTMQAMGHGVEDIEEAVGVAATIGTLIG